jgi:hypothetical protein
VVLHVVAIDIVTLQGDTPATEYLDVGFDVVELGKRVTRAYNDRPFEMEELS